MIVRAIYGHPELAKKFDHFNDYTDTVAWLRRLRTATADTDKQKRIDDVILELDRCHHSWRRHLEGKRLPQ